MKPIGEVWSYWIMFSGTSYSLIPSVGLLNKEVSSLVQRALGKVDGVNSTEFRKYISLLPVLHLQPNAIDSSAAELRALTFREQGVSADDLNELLSWILDVACPRMKKLAELKEILECYQDNGSPVANFVIPAPMILTGDADKADVFAEQKRRQLAPTPGLVKQFSSYYRNLANANRIRHADDHRGLAATLI